MFHSQTTIHYKRLFLFCFCQSDEKINALEIWVITYVKPESLMLEEDARHRNALHKL